MRGSYYQRVMRAEREGGVWRWHLDCGHSVMSLVQWPDSDGGVFCSHCYLAAGRRVKAALDAELRRLTDACP